MPRVSNPVGPNASAWRLLGAAVRHWREQVRCLSQRDLAKAALVDQGELSRWERGLVRPHVDHIKAIDDVLGANGQITAIHTLATELDRFHTQVGKGKTTEENATERRKLLHLAATGAALGALGISGEPVRQLLDLSLDHDFRTLEEWDLACVDHLHALRARPPRQVAADLVIDLMTVRRQMTASAPAEVAALQRVTAALSTVHANALTRLGDHGAAIRWWHTARHAADLSGDFQLRLLVRGEEAGHGLYGQRDPATVLRLVHSAEQIAGKPSVDLLTTRAKALTLLGRDDEARETLDALLRLAQAGVTADPLGFWRENQIYFAESWVHAGTGNEAAADKAGSRVAGFTSDYQYRANVALHGAWCTVVRGGTDEGVRRAAATIDALQPAYRSTHILETGRTVLREVPLDQRDRPAVGEFREVLAIEPARSA